MPSADADRRDAPPTPVTDPTDEPTPVIVAAAVGDPNAGGGPGAGGPADDGGPLSFVLGSASSPNPFLAWLIASAGGLLLFLFLVRRSDRRDREGAGSLALAAAYPGVAPDMRGPIPAGGAAVAAAGRGRQKAEKPPEAAKGRQAREAGQGRQEVRAGAGRAGGRRRGGRPAAAEGPPEHHQRAA